MKKQFLLTALALVGTLSAADYSLSGSIKADGGIMFTDSNWASEAISNHDISLSHRIDFEQKTAVEFYTAMRSTMVDPNDSTQRILSYVGNPERNARVDDADSRWTSVALDGVAFFWEFSNQAQLVVGDVMYSAGATNYTPYNSTLEFATIMSDVTLRGLGVHMGEEGKIYLGAPEANRNALWGFASYNITLVDRTEEKMSLRPVGDVVLRNGGRERRWTLGTEFAWSRTSKSGITYGVDAAAGMIPFGTEDTYTLLTEPFLSMGDFSISGSFYQGFLAESDSALDLQTSLPVQRFAMIEPAIQVHPKAAIALAGEFQDRDDEMNDNEFFAASPKVYVYPNAEVSLTFGFSYRWIPKAEDLAVINLTAQADF